MEIKVFDDFELFTKQLRIENSSQKASEFLSALDIGSTDDGTDDEQRLEQLRLQRLAMQGLGEEYGTPL